MNTILALVSTQSLLGLLLYVAVACVVLWAVLALLKWSGISIPQPVRIILIALGCIALIIWLFRVFGVLV